MVDAALLSPLSKPPTLPLQEGGGARQAQGLPDTLGGPSPRDLGVKFSSAWLPCPGCLPGPSRSSLMALEPTFSRCAERRGLPELSGASSASFIPLARRPPAGLPPPPPRPFDWVAWT